MISFCILIAINLAYGYFQNIDLGVWKKIREKEDASSENEQFMEHIQIIDEKWNITIPKIGLRASISEGVSGEILDKYIGHYENSGTVSSNICLKAYSSGNHINYFENIKNLRVGDEIIYKRDNFTCTYTVKFSGVINYNDISFLTQGVENIITLITNIENETQYLRCVQAVIEDE